MFQNIQTQQFQHNWPIWIQLFTKLTSDQVFFRRAISSKSTSAMIIDSKGNDSSLFHRIKNESTIFQPTLYSIRTLYFLSLARIDIRQNDLKKLEGKPIPVDSIESTRIAKFSDTLHNTRQ